MRLVLMMGVDIIQHFSNKDGQT